MTEDNQDEPDSSSSLKPTRRQVIGTLAGTGVLASMAAGQTGGGAGGTVLGIGGGDMADAAQEFRIKYYKDTMANRPAAGVVGRVYEVWDPSDSANHGKVFHDTGTAWELVDRQVGTLTAEGVDITERLLFDHSENFPFPTRSFERSGPLAVVPHAGAPNPVLAGADVTDMSADSGVADPFWGVVDDTIHMFFEAITAGGNGNIAHATSKDGLSWTYDQLVIDSASHYAWPYWIRWGGSYYMMPAVPGSNPQIWEPSSFPTGWSSSETITDISQTVDPALFRWGGRWWIFVADTSGTDQTHAYYSGETDGGPAGLSWSAHPSNPIHSGNSSGRPAGRPIVRDNYIDFYWMDTTDGASSAKIRPFRITELTPTAFTDTEMGHSPILRGAGVGWNRDGMHTIDALMPYVGGPSLVLTDGYDGDWEIGVYTVGNPNRSAQLELDTNQTGVSSGSFAVVEYDSVQYDLDGNLDTTANSFTAPVSGLYTFSAAATLNNVSGAPFRARLQLYNGTTALKNWENQVATNDLDTVTFGPYSQYMSADTELQIRIFQNSGSTLDIIDGTFRAGRADV